MLSLSKVSSFNTSIGSLRTVPNRGNSFTLQLSPSQTSNIGISVAGNKYFFFDSANSIVNSGTTWTSLSPTTVSFKPICIAHNGANEYLLAGTSGIQARFATSTNGTTWTNLSTTVSDYSATNYSCTIWDGIQFVVGAGSTIFKGATGATLNQTASNVAGDALTTIFSIASNQTRAVFSAAQKIYYTDTLFQTTTYSGISSTFVIPLAYGNNVFVGGGNGCVYVSPDGINWATITGAFGTDYINSITFYSDSFFAFAGTVFYQSVDGYNWIKKTVAVPGSAGSISFNCLNVNSSTISGLWRPLIGNSFTLYSSP